MKTIFLILSLSLISYTVSSQKWKKKEMTNGDMITQIWTFNDIEGQTDYTEIGDNGLYSILKYVKTENGEKLVSEVFFNRHHKPIEMSGGYHKKVRFEEGFFEAYFRYYSKNGKQLRRVEVDVFWDDFSDVSLKFFEYDRRGNLVSLSFFKTQVFDSETFEDLDEPIKIPTGKAYFEADVHKYVWKIKKRKGILIQKIYDPYGELVGQKALSLPSVE